MKVFTCRVVVFLAVAVAVVALMVSGSSPSQFLPGLASAARRDIESNPLAAFGRGSDRNAILARLKMAHITSELPPGTLDSYKTDACIFAGTDLLAGRARKDCIKGTRGIFMPSSAYLMIEAGSMRVAELANADGGWRITAVLNNTGRPPTQTTIRLTDLKLGVLKEQIAHSLVSLIRLLNAGSESELSRLKLSGTSSHILVMWAEGGTSNQFFFNRTGLLCEKQIRTTPEGITVLKYSQYKNVNGVMLPYRIEMQGLSGKVISTEVVAAWGLGAVWPTSFFTPEGFRGF